MMKPNKDIMALYTTIHLHNVPPDREPEYAQWFEQRFLRLGDTLKSLAVACDIDPAQLAVKVGPRSMAGMPAACFAAI